MTEHRPWELLGADDDARLTRLREIVSDFYERVFDDAMIGFLFWGKDRHRLIEMEVQFVARALGGGLPYTGRSMPDAHRSVNILGGHFERRQQILRNVLAGQDVPEPVREAWLEHNERLRAVVTRKEC